MDGWSDAKRAGFGCTLQRTSARMMNARLRRFVAAAVLVALSLTGTPARSVEPSGEGDAAFAVLAKAYYDAGFAAAPVTATNAGLHQFDARLGSYSAVDFAVRIDLDRDYLERFTKLDSQAFSPSVRLDWMMVINAIQDDLLQNNAMKRWRHNADDYVNIATGGVFSILSRKFAPDAIRLAKIVAREKQIPAMFAQARVNLRAVDKYNAQIAYDDAMGAVSFLKATVPEAFPTAGDETLRAEFVASTQAAVDATRDFARWLKTGFVTHPVGNFAIGAANYTARLKYEEAIDMPLDAYLRVGVVALAQTRAQMVAVAKQIDPNKSVQAVIDEVARIHPTAAGLIPASQADLVKLRAFEERKHIIEFPADADIKVTLTPEFERQTSIASMDAPGPLESVATQAYYNVTPVDPKDPPKVQQSYLETFNDFERPIVSAHEVYPGHYTNYIIDKHLKLSLTGKLLAANSFVEGWAHYCEQMIVDEGWGDGDPRVRLMQLREAILRNARYVVGVKMHTQGMTVPAAMDFFQKQAFVDPASSRIEARRGTGDPLYGYYTLGKLEILKLRADYKKKMGTSFTLAGFHQALLAHGNPPVPLLRPFLLGDDDDGKIL